MPSPINFLITFILPTFKFKEVVCLLCLNNETSLIAIDFLIIFFLSTQVKPKVFIVIFFEFLILMFKFLLSYLLSKKP